MEGKMPSKLEEAIAGLDAILYRWSGLATICVKDIKPQLEALIRTAKDEEAEEIAALHESHFVKNPSSPTADIKYWSIEKRPRTMSLYKGNAVWARHIRARIAARGKGGGPDA